MDGNHTVSISDGQKNGQGTYTVFAQRTNDPGRSVPLLPGDNRLVSLNTCGEVDTYTIDARSGDRLRIDMIPDTIGNVRPQLALYGSAGEPIDLPGGGSINRVVTSNGPFTLLAYSAVDETGTYRISLTIEPGPPSLLLVSTGCTECQPGDIAGFDIQVTNPGPSVLVELKAGVRLTDGTPINLLGRHLEEMLPSGTSVIHLFSEVVPPGTPTGQYTIEAGMLEPELGVTISRQSVPLQVLP